MTRLLILLFAAAAVMAGAGCANQVAPAGGPRDTIPPQVRAMEPPNFSTHFSGHEVTFTFDEYVQVKDLSAQLIVSPPLEKAPATRLRRKTLTLELPDSLASNTTYSLNFGQALADLNEGNPLLHFSYVFSTGDYIDTLSVSGSVIRATDRKPAKGVKVMLYTDPGDSLPYTHLPRYFALTDDKGRFTVTNIASGNYKIFAKEESNNNYRYDSPDESIAFREQGVDAGAEGLALTLFREEVPLRLHRAASEEPGKVVVSMSRPSSGWSFRFAGDTSGLGMEQVTYSSGRDTAVIWYHNRTADSLSLLVDIGDKTDTVVLRLRRAGDKSGKGAPAVFTLTPSAGHDRPIDAWRPLVFHCSHPVAAIDTGGWMLSEDSAAVPCAPVTDSLRQSVLLAFPWKEGKRYALGVRQGAATDIFGIPCDSMRFDFNVHPASAYGTLRVKLQARAFSGQYLLQLVHSGGQVSEQRICHSDTTLLLERLWPGTYTLRIVADRNSNGKEDTGHYLEGLQPEDAALYPDPITVRANWDVDVAWPVTFGAPASSR